MGVSRNSEKVIVELRGVQRSDISVKTIERYAGSSQRDAAVMEVINVGRNDNVDTAFNLLDKFPNSICKIALQSKGLKKYIHYGRITGGRYVMSGSDRVLQLVSRFDDQMLGEPLKSRVVEIQRAGGLTATVIQTLDRELVFNPRYEGQIYGNKNFLFNLALVPVFIDLNGIPLSFLTLPQTSKFTQWSIADAVYYLCQDLNSGQKHVQNPLWTEISAILPTNIYLNNVSIPVGVFLGEALDRILNPFGYHWKIKHESSTLRKIEFFSRTDTTVSKIKLTKHVPGTVFNDSIDLVSDIDLTVDHNDNAYNRVTVIGGRKRYEITVNLLPDWDEELTNEPISSYFWDSFAMQRNSALRNVYRKFKADLSVLSALGITNNVKARRPMLPCLTLDKSGQPYGTHRGVFVEVSLDGGGLWNAVDSTGLIGGIKQALSLDLMENEAAILFTGKIFPAYFRRYKDKFKLRATATFELDECITESIAVPLAGAPLEDEKELVISAPDRFQYHERSNLSVFVNGTSVAGIINFTNAVIDSTFEMKAFAYELLDTYAVSNISGKVSLHGVDNISEEYLGRPIEELPRGVFLDTRPIYGGKFPVCTGVVYDIDGQKTELQIGDFSK